MLTTSSNCKMHLVFKDFISSGKDVNICIKMKYRMKNSSPFPAPQRSYSLGFDYLHERQYILKYLENISSKINRIGKDYLCALMV